MDYKKTPMKQISVALLFSLLNLQFNWIPSTGLLLAVGASIVLDFITGVARAIVQKQNRTSEGYRKTVIKFIQYGGAILVSMLLSYISEQNQNLIKYEDYIKLTGNALLCFIIFIEATSVFENMYAMDSSTMFSRYFIKPILSLLTFQIKNNPVTKIKAGEEEEKKL